jgi:hypothetical protein
MSLRGLNNKIIQIYTPLGFIRRYPPTIRCFNTLNGEPICPFVLAGELELTKKGMKF